MIDADGVPIEAPFDRARLIPDAGSCRRCRQQPTTDSGVPAGAAGARRRPRQGQGPWRWFSHRWIVAPAFLPAGPFVAVVGLNEGLDREVPAEVVLPGADERRVRGRVGRCSRRVARLLEPVRRPARRRIPRTDLVSQPLLPRIALSARASTVRVVRELEPRADRLHLARRLPHELQPASSRSGSRFPRTMSTSTSPTRTSSISCCR